ncbi:acetyl-CoA carboxylase carboxyltransferase subunit alpha [Anaeromyxobacter paludicola]|uniref:Acetyl-coenzyme A carboxylase carboxyl transferase subunit alpha n=1 Tax=Anaeromyxobacter paludicola TaxID=2918171 RepID=A0ABM7X7N4_9BACT|nr:acetyl-CoA carboxylase carboxyltransferase subunit alpha [Anaeromyxobacter paludicola]BDG07839.1 acetyl-coenzyme A carboxylase carboxyl transferase subunit alpha [Anaeromyxobacter paludicola]
MARTVYTLEFERPLLALEAKIAELKQLSTGTSVDFSDEIAKLEKKSRKLQAEIFRDLSRWQIVQLARHPNRPYTLDYVSTLFTDFVELEGDRRFAADRAIVAGFARFEGEPVLVIGHQKGRSTKENMLRNFGMPRPEGYRKARRLFDLADRFRRPIITFIDTPGAYPGIGAEERGQAEAIAVNLEVMASLGVPVISVVIGEGGSGGALGLGVANRILMLQYAWYNVISPESCSSILYRDASKAEKSADALKLTAKDLQSFGIVDQIVEESAGGAHRDAGVTAGNVAAAIRRHLGELSKLSPEELVRDRYEKFRAMGVYAAEG